MPPTQTYHLSDEHHGLTLAQALKRLLPDRSWNQVKRLIAGRQVQVNGNLVLDEGRRVKESDVLKVWQHSLAGPVSETDIRVAYADEHLVVIQKPAGITTLRHREETDLPTRRKQLQPTLDELVPRALARHLGRPLGDAGPNRKAAATPSRGTRRRRTATTGRGDTVRAVHRLDRDTSGLMVFARTPQAEQALVRMFARHAVQRAYVAVVPGRVEAQTIDTFLVRDRGDGLRGSTPLGAAAEGARRAITHVRPMEHIAAPGGETAYTILECRLETGRTHQIRIHLSEIGHPLCGEKLYTHARGGQPIADTSGAPRQALHAAELAFHHPLTQEPLRFRMPLPPELKTWLLKLRGK